MTVAITVTEQTNWPGRVLISVTGLTVTGTADAVDVYRSVGGERTALRAGSTDAVIDPSFIVIDAEMPFGIPVSYVAIVNGADEYTTSPVTYVLTGGKVALTDAITGQAAEVIIRAWDEKSYRRPSSTFKVGGRNVVVMGDLGMFEGSIELYTENTSSRDNLFTLLETATEGVIQIRQSGTYDGVDAYVAIIGVTDRRFSQDGSDERRLFALDVAEVESWSLALEARGFSLQDIANAYAGLTLQDLANGYATLLEIAQGDFS